ncbi:MAG: hypothetical protein RIR33_3831 [Pseudomonadota bacterium]|jgi:uncharacterized protein YbaP (TraB family)
MTGLAAFGRLLRDMAISAAAVIGLSGAPALAQPAMWAVRDADSTLYMLGTVHLLRPETQWRTPALDKAIAEAEELWLELPTTDAAAMAVEMMPLVARYGLSPGKRLSDVLTREEMKTLDEAAKLAGLSASQLNMFRPWFAALTISNAAVMRAGYDPLSGVDSKIEALFLERGIKPKGLETAELQIRVFAGMTPEQELRYLRETMEEYGDAPIELDAMVDQWARADLPALEAMFVSEMKTEEPDLYAALLTNRNASWVSQIEGILAGKGVSFMAVGAGHLIGPDSVIAMLEARGVTAERVQ